MGPRLQPVFAAGAFPFTQGLCKFQRVGSSPTKEVPYFAAIVVASRSPIYLLISVVFFSLFTVSELRCIIIMDRNRVTEQDGELGAGGAAKNYVLMHWPVVASRTVTRLCKTKQTRRKHGS